MNTQLSHQGLVPGIPKNIATIKPELSKDQGDLVAVSYNELSRGKV